VSGTWTRIEITRALVRAARAGRADLDTLLATFAADIAPPGRIRLLTAPQTEAEAGALEIVREHAVRSLDAWHLACARIVLPRLAERGEELGFATRDAGQAAVAELLGLTPRR